ncbi:Biotin-protein ligase / Biotinoperon repressor [Streptococcus sp. HSISM1]|nr:Biotin-protein ligase / Biotinoperon repressor [Streptococcus sp. HSISM1]
MKTHEILFQTLSQADDYVNGEQLAKELGVSRTSIWKAIQRLEKDGVVIESLKKKGYRLVSGDILLPEVIASNTQLTVTLNEECHSTQLDAKLGMEAHKEGRALYLATSQSAGKGRFGRDYYSPDQGGIYMSLHLKPQLPPAELPPYTLMVAGAIYKAIKNLTLIDVDIKWVNDIYYRHKKLGES